MIIENKNDKSFIIVNKGAVQDNSAAPESTRELILNVCRSIREGGYNPVSQIVGYILSDDPTHIANYNNARNLICHIDRDELIEEIVSVYIDLIENEQDDSEK
jgi:uncharacterized protein (UPF0297 family)